MKPLGALYALNGILEGHDRRALDKYYSALHATPSRVLKVLKEPIVMNSAQACVYGYLLQFVGNMKTEEARRFVRFVTGSSALVVDEINVDFNHLSGLSRRPIAHTCASTLELPTSYTTCVEFCEEFQP